MPAIATAAVLGLLVFLLAPRPGSTVSEPPERQTGEVPETVERLAPRLYLYSKEPSFPMSAARFLSGSTLRWRTCRFKQGPVLQARPDPDRVDEHAADLAQGRFRHAVEMPNGRRCTATPRETATNELSRPLGPRPDDGSGIPPDQGFYLDVVNGLRRGTRTGEIDVPVYYEYEPERFVTYWFFYAYSGSAPSRIRGAPRPLARLIARWGGAHEGDWETVSIRLSPDDDAEGGERPDEVAFFQHGRPSLVPWATLEAQGSLDDGRPVVYSAKSSHASYPDIGHHPFRLRVGRRIVSGLHDRTDRGFLWRTERRLRDARTEPWYGFGGAWGAPATFTGGAQFRDIGPLGPSRYKGAVPCEWALSDPGGVPLACDRALGPREVPGF